MEWTPLHRRSQGCLLLGLAASAHLHTERNNPCTFVRSKKKSKPANFCGFFTGCPSSDFKLFPTAGCQLHSGLPYRRPSPDVTCGQAPASSCTSHTALPRSFFFSFLSSMPPSAAAASRWIRFDTSSSSSPEHYSKGAFSF